MRTRVMSAFVVALSIAVSGCSSDDKDSGSAKAGSNKTVSDNGSSNDTGNESEGKSSGSGDGGAQHTFIYPTLDAIEAAFGYQYESRDLAGQPAECKGNFPKAVSCDFKRIPSSTEDGVASLIVACDYRSSGTDDTSPQGWVDANKSTSGDEVEEDKTLPVPAIWSAVGTAALADEQKGLTLDLAFAVDGQVPLTVCQFSAESEFDDSIGERRPINVSATRAAILDLAKKAVQEK